MGTAPVSHRAASSGSRPSRSPSRPRCSMLKAP